MAVHDPVTRSNQIDRTNKSLRELVASLTRERDFLRGELDTVQGKLAELECNHTAG